ncbi:hypothetical protein C446_13289 [Halobiforma nitratireducens JCM 10879]|uniref:Uncharacterized protein n=1 Tax=Halobiforma nitratireducens JCM 10879 TaxID=1227454 RepID=M0LNK3_9EURY|nr:hypothetical protein C446_13289 [Halobiforma nitratireducens JCM 10879]
MNDHPSTESCSFGFAAVDGSVRSVDSRAVVAAGIVMKRESPRESERSPAEHPLERVPGAAKQCVDMIETEAIRAHYYRLATARGSIGVIRSR